MKRWYLILAVCLIAFMGCEKQAEASSRRHRTTVIEAQDDHNVGGVKIDAPNLVKLNEEGSWTLGAEGGKDIIKNMFYSDNDYIEADKGYFAYIKVTYSGQVADLTKLFKKKEAEVTE